MSPGAPFALPAVTTASRLMGCSTQDLMLALSTHENAVENIIYDRLTLQQATGARDALASFIYVSLFDWLVEHINKSLQVGMICTGRSINILDLKGFESLHVLYNTCGFLEKSRDSLSSVTMKFLSSCSIHFLQLFTSKVPERFQKPGALSLKADTLDSPKPIVGMKLKIVLLEDKRNKVLRGIISVRKCFRGYRAHHHFHQINQGTKKLRSNVAGENAGRKPDTSITRRNSARKISEVKVSLSAARKSVIANNAVGQSGRVDASSPQYDSEDALSMGYRTAGASTPTNIVSRETNGTSSAVGNLVKEFDPQRHSFDDEAKALMVINEPRGSY